MQRVVSFFLYSVEDIESSTPLLIVPMRFTQIDGAVYGAKALSTVGHMENFSLLSIIFADKLESQKDKLDVLGVLFNVF